MKLNIKRKEEGSYKACGDIYLSQGGGVGGGKGRAGAMEILSGLGGAFHISVFKGVTF